MDTHNARSVSVENFDAALVESELEDTLVEREDSNFLDRQAIHNGTYDRLFGRS